MTKRRTLCEKSDVLIFSVTYVDVVVLPELQTLLFGQIHLIVGLYAEVTFAFAGDKIFQIFRAEF